MDRILIFTATYNEADNIQNLIADINFFLPGNAILVVDDNSPDGTGEILNELSKIYFNVHILHRARKLGLGTAHKIAMYYAIEHGFDYLITMDADYSHHPKYLPILLENLKKNDFVIGSRYMKGGKSGYGISRTFISLTANFLTRALLSISLMECTTSYRGFRVAFLKKLNLDCIRSDGYSFFIEFIYYISLLSKKMKEFPIYFEDRRAGTSKISKQEIFKSILLLKRLFFLKKISLKRSLLSNTQKRKKQCVNCNNKYHINLYLIKKKIHLTGNQKCKCTGSVQNSHKRILQCLHCGLISEDI